ncbi:MarR family winged helix-turn-helix transcriptional regulator [Micromonospora sp. NPDC051227]|uniref:MarR family winged helix-turn-helix transcriptional regulator n=1 Tax=Micromonospora sp. NPDC051227 TaxID=3364285 RepID=UPI00379EBA4A
MSDVPGAPADLLRSLTRAERLLSRRLGAILADDAISIEAWRVLCLLADGQGHPMSEVSVEASLPPGTLTKLVDQLVDRNLVFRRIDPIDRRRIRAYLTARGRREHARLDERVRASIAELGVEQAADLIGRLDDLIGRLDPTRQREHADAVGPDHRPLPRSPGFPASGRPARQWARPALAPHTAESVMSVSHHDDSPTSRS